jgi:hypothetical protein
MPLFKEIDGSARKLLWVQAKLWFEAQLILLVNDRWCLRYPAAISPREEDFDVNAQYNCTDP